jgi:iron complex transport system ATP-binding protein
MGNSSQVAPFGPVGLPPKAPMAISLRPCNARIQLSLKTQSPILEIRDLSIRRDATRILDGIQWRVERGEHWVILGANGSGKTSLLSALTGYLSPTSGDITVLGQTFGESDWRELRKHVGLVSSSVRQMMADHEPALTTVISGKYAMIDYWGRVKAEDKAAASRILKQIEATHLAERPWLVLSQGERQRILIGRALMARPRLLILDEPCAGLDPVARENFLAFLQRLGSRRSAPALILVTHHVEEIALVFSHALLLRGGRALASGRKDEVLTSASLSKAFGAELRLIREEGRYTLEITQRSSASIV